MRSWVAPTPNEEECIRHIPKRMLLLPFPAVGAIVLYTGGGVARSAKMPPPPLIDKEKRPFCFGHGEGRRGRIRIIHKNLFAETKKSVWAGCDRPVQTVWRRRRTSLVGGGGGDMGTAAAAAGGPLLLKCFLPPPAGPPLDLSAGSFVESSEGFPNFDHSFNFF